ncbi:hypothetical protein L9F63_018638, partial [Diploptera punctata]
PLIITFVQCPILANGTNLFIFLGLEIQSRRQLIILKDLKTRYKFVVKASISRILNTKLRPAKLLLRTQKHGPRGLIICIFVFTLTKVAAPA